MTDWPDRLKWTAHDGGPQPVPDDVFVAVVHGRITRKSMGGETVILPAGDADWLRDEHSPVREFAILNQHLIDATNDRIKAMEDVLREIQRGYYLPAFDAQITALLKDTNPCD